MLVTTHPTATSGVVAVHCGKCKIGYVAPSGDGARYLWQFCMRSEVIGAAPMGFADTRRLALERLVQCLIGWLSAAGVPTADLHVELEE